MNKLKIKVNNFYSKEVYIPNHLKFASIHDTPYYANVDYQKSNTCIMFEYMYSDEDKKEVVDKYLTMVYGVNSGKIYKCSYENDYSTIQVKDAVKNLIGRIQQAGGSYDRFNTNTKTISYLIVEISKITNNMKSELIDISLLAAKVATMNDEKARMITGSVSLAYNATQFANFKSMAANYSEILSVLSLKSKYGVLTPQEVALAQQCYDGIESCNQQLAKHGTLAAIDIASMLFDVISQSSKK